jgi:hypothetical protein
MVLALGAFLWLQAGTARAQVAASDPATQSARDHFAEGVKLYDAKPPDYEGALAQFREAYAAKPSAGIKRNIALCLKALQRYPEAMDALEEVLAEGGDTLKADVRDGVNRTLADLQPLVASLRITVRLHATDPRLRPPFELFVDEAPLTPEQLASERLGDGGDGGEAGQRLVRSVRVMPGAHTIRVRALGFQEAKKEVTAEAGVVDLPVTVDLFATSLAGLGRLTVRVEPAVADIAVDGVVLARGSWSGEVGVGSHRVTVNAPGFGPFVTEVTTVAGDARVLPVRLVALPMHGPGGPEKGTATAKKVSRVRNNYVTIAMPVQSEGLTPTAGAFMDTTNTKRSFGGLTFTARYGRKLGRGFALDLFGEAGGMTTTYSGNRITVTNWVLAPELAYHTPGVIRFLGGVAVGAEGQLTDASVVSPTVGSSNVEVSGHGLGPMGLIEAGVEGGPWPLFFQATIFGELHGTRASDGLGNTLYVESSTVRGGLRLVVGLEL